MSSLTPTAKVILGFLRFEERSGYDIKQAVEVSTRFFWGASFGQIYPELRRLEARGLVEVEHSAGEGRRRTVYRLTEAGNSALLEWLADEGAGEDDLFLYRDEGMLRLFFSDFADRETALANVRRMRAWREQMTAFLHKEIEPYAAGDVELGYVFPARALELGIAMLSAQTAWLAALEEELADELRPR
jgi:DNA-binding PadR family transcriptional regulator